MHNSKYRILNSTIDDSTDSGILFTPAALLDLLSQIEEFEEFDLGLSESLSGDLQLQVGNSYYDLQAGNNEVEIELDDMDLEAIEDSNSATYEDLIEDGATSEEPIESGIIKEALKTLMIGGVVRLAKHYLTK